MRSVHFGPGAFHRAHQAWYTERADPGWGIAAVTARSDDMVERLGGQDGLYTLVTRGPRGDEAAMVGAIAEVVGHADPRVQALLVRPEVTVVTLTLTEAGYGATSPVLARLVAGLDARRRADAGPLAVLSCDNLSGNGRLTRERVTALAAGTPGLEQWISASCTFADTVVDRITPATGADDLATAARLTGWDDRAAVVTEPWSEWVIGETPGAGPARPPWEQAGVRLVADVGPWERRKLRLLNAGHSMLAYGGLPRGHRWVHDAAADPVLQDAVRALWREAREALPGTDGTDLDDYCARIEERWTNARLPHALAQIGLLGSGKLRQRILPTWVAARAGGREPVASAFVLAAWLAQMRAGTVSDPDVAAAELTGPPPRAARAALLALRGPAQRAAAAPDGLACLPAGDDGLAGDAWSVATVADELRRLEARPA